MLCLILGTIDLDAIEVTVGNVKLESSLCISKGFDVVKISFNTK
jgi:hypothetical protein